MENNSTSTEQAIGIFTRAVKMFADKDGKVTMGAKELIALVNETYELGKNNGVVVYRTANGDTAEPAQEVVMLQEIIKQRDATIAELVGQLDKANGIAPQAETTVPSEPTPTVEPTEQSQPNEPAAPAENSDGVGAEAPTAENPVSGGIE